MVFEKLKEILAEQLDVDANSITQESMLIEDLGADSLDAIDIVMSIEDEFKIEVPDEIIEKIETVGDMLNYIENNIWQKDWFNRNSWWWTNYGYFSINLVFNLLIEQNVTKV